MAIQLTDGTILPDIPISAEFPFSVIMKNMSMEDGTSEFVSEYVLLQTSEKFMYVPLEVSGGSYDAIGIKGSGAFYLYDSSLNQWVFQESNEFDPDSNEFILFPLSVEGWIILVWSDYDIMVAEKNAEGDYIETTIVANLIETYKDYNGTILPSLPFDVTNSYQYSSIFNMSISDEENYYLLMTSTKPTLYIPQQIATEDFEEEHLHDGALLLNGDIKIYVCSPLMSLNNWIFGGVTPEGTLSPNVESVNTAPCIWTNFDIMVATKDENGEYIATDRVYDAIVDMVDYNGTILPEIPFDDTNEYKYAFILKAIEQDYDSEKLFIYGYYLFTSTTKDILYTLTESNLDSNGQALYLGGALHLTSNCKVYFYSPTEGHFNWKFEDFSENISPDALVPLVMASLLWTNFDIMIATKNENGEYVATDTIYDVVVDMVDYNGIILPEIPQSNFKNVILFEDKYYYDDATTSYFLTISEAQCSFFPGTEFPPFEENDQLIAKSGFISNYIYTPEIGQWVCIYGETLSSDLPIEATESFSILWSNYTVKKVVLIEDVFAEIGNYYPPDSEEPLPDIEHESNFYTVPADFLSSVATQARRFSNNSTRMTTEDIVEAFVNTGDYRKIFDKTVKKVDFELPEVLFPFQFAYCYNLESIETEKTKYILDHCFTDCCSLQKISLPSVEIIKYYAFYNCTNLSTVNLPEVSKIEESAFENCINLSTIDLPKVNRIYDYAFYNCTNLSTVNLPEVSKIENGIFYNCTNLSTIDLPKVNEINYRTFHDCSALTNIVLPNVINIQNSAFENCTSLNVVDLPCCISFGNLSYNSSYIFFNCSNLTTLILRAPKKCSFPSNGSVFYNTPIASGTGYIYVPSALLESYIADPIWGTYATQFRAIENYPDICGTEIGWINGDKDITEKLKRGQIGVSSPYIYNSDSRIAYVDLDLIVNEGDNISVNIPENYTFKIYVLNNNMVGSYLSDNNISFNSYSDWLVKGETYTIPSDSPCAIWIEIAKEDTSQAIEISELGTVTVTKNITQ